MLLWRQWVFYSKYKPIQIREKKSVMIEVIPEDGFSEDDEALTADLVAFLDARRALTSATRVPLSSDNGQQEVIHE